jgi:hypothetical protein
MSQFTDSELPCNCAFVVQFSGPGAYAGRAEHVVSNRAIHFESKAELDAFIESVFFELRCTSAEAGEE